MFSRSPVIIELISARSSSRAYSVDQNPASVPRTSVSRLSRSGWPVQWPQLVQGGLVERWGVRGTGPGTAGRCGRARGRSRAPVVRGVLDLRPGVLEDLLGRLDRAPLLRAAPLRPLRQPLALLGVEHRIRIHPRGAEGRESRRPACRRRREPACRPCRAPAFWPRTARTGSECLSLPCESPEPPMLLHLLKGSPPRVAVAALGGPLGEPHRVPHPGRACRCLTL